MGVEKGPTNVCSHVAGDWWWCGPWIDDHIGDLYLSPQHFVFCMHVNKFYVYTNIVGIKLSSNHDFAGQNMNTQRAHNYTVDPKRNRSGLEYMEVIIMAVHSQHQTLEKWGTSLVLLSQRKHKLKSWVDPRHFGFENSSYLSPLQHLLSFSPNIQCHCWLRKRPLVFYSNNIYSQSICYLVSTKNK